MLYMQVVTFVVQTAQTQAKTSFQGQRLKNDTFYLFTAKQPVIYLVFTRLCFTEVLTDVIIIIIITVILIILFFFWMVLDCHVDHLVTANS